MNKERLIKILSYVVVALLSVSLTMMVMLWTMPQQQQGQSKLDALEALILQCFIGEKDQTAMEDAAAADEMFTVLMGEKVEPRKEFIEQNAKFVKNLDI